MLCRATQDGWVLVESSDKMCSIGEGNGKPLQYSCLENPMNSMKKPKDNALKDELPRSVCAQYATGEQWRNNTRMNGEMEPKQKQHQVVDVTGDGSVRGVCNFLGSVLSQKKSEASEPCYSPRMDQCYSSVLQLSFI